MKFELSKVGLIDEATLELADLTILCGENNTGKTYVTYALYGFLHSWRQLFATELRLNLRKELLAPKNQIDLGRLFFWSYKFCIYNGSLNAMHKNLPRVFASNPKLLALPK